MEKALKQLEDEKFSQFNQSEKDVAIKYYNALKDYFEEFINYDWDEPAIVLSLCCGGYKIDICVYEDGESVLSYDEYREQVVYGEFLPEDMKYFDTMEDCVEYVSELSKLYTYCFGSCDYNYWKCQRKQICPAGIIDWKA